MFRIGLNPYGIAYSVGLFAADTPRANPKPLGLHGFLNVVDRFDLAGVEVPVALLKNISPDEGVAVEARLHSRGKYAILMHGISWGDLNDSLEVAKIFTFSTIRLHLTAVLCGGRAHAYAPDSDWPRIIADARKQLISYNRKAQDAGIKLTIENHQDLTSGELVEICQECGSNVGICLDTGNPLSVGEDPVEFARAVAPWVRHVHLKDYIVCKQIQGYRLVRCAIGDGEIPFDEIAKILAPNGPLPASIEPGALEGRYIRLLDPKWWTHYPRRDAQSLALCMQRVWPRLRREEIVRTPWELDATPAEVSDYEREQLRKSLLYVCSNFRSCDQELMHKIMNFSNWEN